MSSKKLLILAGFLTFSGHAMANRLNKNGILTDDSGAIIMTTPIDALNACPQGTRLLTARELAQRAASQDAAGIVEVDQAKNGANVFHFDLIDAAEPNGKTDQFYYGLAGYVPNRSNFGNPFDIGHGDTAVGYIDFCSSSRAVRFPGYFYRLEGQEGSLGALPGGNEGVVALCAALCKAI